MLSMSTQVPRVISLLSQDNDSNSHKSLSQKGENIFLEPLFKSEKTSIGAPESFPFHSIGRKQSLMGKTESSLWLKLLHLEKCKVPLMSAKLNFLKYTS